MLSVADLFMFRRTCNEAWTKVSHQPFSTACAWKHVDERASRQFLSSVHFPMLQWCWDNGCYLPGKLIGMVPGIEVEDRYFRGPSEILDILEGAVEAGNEKLVLHICKTYKQKLPFDLVTCFEYRVARGKLPMLELIDDDPRSWVDCISAILPIGHLDVISWVLGYVPFPNDTLIESAARSGKLEVVRLVTDHLAASRITENRHADPRVVSIAAHWGGIPMVKFLLDEWQASLDGVFDWGDVYEAPVSVVKWLVECGAPFPDDVLRRAVANGTADVVEFFLDRYTPKPPRLLLDALMCSEKDGVVDILARHGVTPVTSVPYVCNRFPRHAKRVHELFETTLPVDFMQAALIAEDIPCIRYGIENGCQMPRDLSNERLKFLRSIFSAEEVETILGAKKD